MATTKRRSAQTTAWLAKAKVSAAEAKKATKLNAITASPADMLAALSLLADWRAQAPTERATQTRADGSVVLMSFTHPAGRAEFPDVFAASEAITSGIPWKPARVVYRLAQSGKAKAAAG
jgi:hypothetical protein